MLILRTSFSDSFLPDFTSSDIDDSLCPAARFVSEARTLFRTFIRGTCLYIIYWGIGIAGGTFVSLLGTLWTPALSQYQVSRYPLCLFYVRMTLRTFS